MRFHLIFVLFLLPLKVLSNTCEIHLSQIENLTSAINNCTSEENQLLTNAIKNLKSRHTVLKEEITTKLSQGNLSSGIKRRVRDISKTMECISSEIDKGILYFCNPNGCIQGQYGHIEGRLGRNHRDEYIQPLSRSVNMCMQNLSSNNFRSNYFKIIESTLYHELSHLCGTVDYQLVNQFAENPSNAFTAHTPNWHNSSHHFGAWYSLGFYLPGVDYPF